MQYEFFQYLIVFYYLYQSLLSYILLNLPLTNFWPQYDFLFLFLLFLSRQFTVETIVWCITSKVLRSIFVCLCTIYYIYNKYYIIYIINIMYCILQYIYFISYITQMWTVISNLLPFCPLFYFILICQFLCLMEK